jgi:hypothetical protein
VELDVQTVWNIVQVVTSLVVQQLCVAFEEQSVVNGVHVVTSLVVQQLWVALVTQ